MRAIAILVASAVAVFTPSVAEGRRVPTCFGERATVVGTGGNDVLRAGYDDVVVGLGGNDVIYGHRYSDGLCGSDGNDWIRGTHGADEIAGGRGADTIYGLGQMDTLRGGRGGDLVVGDPRGLVPELWASDDLFGGSGDDRLYAFGGADLLYGDSGDDLLAGGHHQDVLLPGTGDDVVRGGDERGGDVTDVVVYRDSAEPVSVDLGAGRSAGEGTDRLDDVEGVSGTAFDDHLVGSPAPDLLVGAGGADSLIGLDGDDFFGPDLTAHDSGGVGAVDEPADDFADGGRGVDGILFAPAEPSPMTIDLVAGTAAGEGEDRIASIENVSTVAYAAATIRGSDDPNLILTFTDGDDFVEALGGDDRVFTESGTDEVDGGDGFDECGSAEIVRNCESYGSSSAYAALVRLRYLSIGTPTRLPYSVHDPS